MANFKRVLSMVLSVAMLLTFASFPAFAETTPKMNLVADKTQVNAGEIVKITIELENNPGFEAANPVVVYDATAFEVVNGQSGSPKATVGADFAEETPTTSMASDNGGKLSYAYIPAGAVAISANGKFVTFQFTAKEGVNKDCKFKLENPESGLIAGKIVGGENIPVSFTLGSVNVTVGTPVSSEEPASSEAASSEEPVSSEEPASSEAASSEPASSEATSSEATSSTPATSAADIFVTPKTVQMLPAKSVSVGNAGIKFFERPTNNLYVGDTLKFDGITLAKSPKKDGVLTALKLVISNEYHWRGGYTDGVSAFYVAIDENANVTGLYPTLADANAGTNKLDGVKLTEAGKYAVIVSLGYVGTTEKALSSQTWIDNLTHNENPLRFFFDVMEAPTGDPTVEAPEVPTGIAASVETLENADFVTDVTASNFDENNNRYYLIKSTTDKKEGSPFVETVANSEVKTVAYVEAARLDFATKTFVEDITITMMNSHKYIKYDVFGSLDGENWYPLVLDGVSDNIALSANNGVHSIDINGVAKYFSINFRDIFDQWGYVDNPGIVLKFADVVQDVDNFVPSSNVIDLVVNAEGTAFKVPDGVEVEIGDTLRFDTTQVLDMGAYLGNSTVVSIDKVSVARRASGAADWNWNYITSLDTEPGYTADLKTSGTFTITEYGEYQGQAVQWGAEGNKEHKWLENFSVIDPNASSEPTSSEAASSEEPASSEPASSEATSSAPAIDYDGPKTIVMEFVDNQYQIPAGVTVFVGDTITFDPEVQIVNNKDASMKRNLSWCVYRVHFDKDLDGENDLGVYKSDGASDADKALKNGSFVATTATSYWSQVVNWATPAIDQAWFRSFTALAVPGSEGTSSEATSSEATSSDVTSSEATSSEATSSEEPASSEPASSEATSSEVTSSEVVIPPVSNIFDTPKTVQIQPSKNTSVSHSGPNFFERPTNNLYVGDTLKFDGIKLASVPKKNKQALNAFQIVIAKDYFWRGGYTDGVNAFYVAIDENANVTGLYPTIDDAVAGTNKVAGVTLTEAGKYAVIIHRGYVGTSEVVLSSQTWIDNFKHNENPLRFFLDVMEVPSGATTVYAPGYSDDVKNSTSKLTEADFVIDVASADFNEDNNRFYLIKTISNGSIFTETTINAKTLKIPAYAEALRLDFATNTYVKDITISMVKERGYIKYDVFGSLDGEKWYPIVLDGVSNDSNGNHTIAVDAAAKYFRVDLRDMATHYGFIDDNISVPAFKLKSVNATQNIDIVDTTEEIRKNSYEVLSKPETESRISDSLGKFTLSFEVKAVREEEPEFKFFSDAEGKNPITPVSQVVTLISNDGNLYYYSVEATFAATQEKNTVYVVYGSTNDYRFETGRPEAYTVTLSSEIFSGDIFEGENTFYASAYQIQPKQTIKLYLVTQRITDDVLVVDGVEYTNIRMDVTQIASLGSRTDYADKATDFYYDEENNLWYGYVTAKKDGVDQFVATIELIGYNTQTEEDEVIEVREIQTKVITIKTPPTSESWGNVLGGKPGSVKFNDIIAELKKDYANKDYVLVDMSDPTKLTYFSEAPYNREVSAEFWNALKDMNKSRIIFRGHYEYWDGTYTEFEKDGNNYTVIKRKMIYEVEIKKEHHNMLDMQSGKKFKIAVDSNYQQDKVTKKNSDTANNVKAALGFSHIPYYVCLSTGWDNVPFVQATWRVEVAPFWYTLNGWQDCTIYKVNLVNEGGVSLAEKFTNVELKSLYTATDVPFQYDKSKAIFSRYFEYVAEDGITSMPMILVGDDVSVERTNQTDKNNVATGGADMTAAFAVFAVVALGALALKKRK